MAIGTEEKVSNPLEQLWLGYGPTWYPSELPWVSMCLLGNAHFPVPCLCCSTPASGPERRVLHPLPRNGAGRHQCAGSGPEREPGWGALQSFHTCLLLHFGGLD